MKCFLIIIGVSGLLLGCSQPANEPLIDLAELQQQLADIQVYIDSATCTEEFGCSYIAVGKKPCGGPAGYLAFPASLDVEVLEKMVNVYNRNQEAYIKRTGAASDCSIVPAPGLLDCIDGKCLIIE